MRVPEYSTRFHRDVNLAQKRGKNMAKLKELLPSSSQTNLCRLDTKTMPSRMTGQAIGMHTSSRTGSSSTASRGMWFVSSAPERTPTSSIDPPSDSSIAAS